MRATRMQLCLSMRISVVPGLWWVWGLEDKKSEAAATEEDRNPDSKNPAIPGSTSGHTGGTLSARRVPHSP